MNIYVDKMPESCECCPCNDDYYRCGLSGDLFDEHDVDAGRMKNCKLKKLAKEGEETKEKTIEFVNGAVLIIKLNMMIDFHEYEKFIKRVEEGVRDGALIVPPGVDVIVIDKEGKAVKA